MIKIKNLFDEVETDDGHRLWVEPINVTADLSEWCEIDHFLCHIGPPMELWEWFQEHPDGYEFFRAEYHDFLAGCPHLDALQQLAAAALHEDFTLLHQGDDPNHNTGTALYEFLAELQAYCEPEL